MTRCPKCSYVRQPGETAPNYECPNCGIVYAKFKAPEPLPQTSASAPVASAAPQPAEEKTGIPASSKKTQSFAKVVMAGGFFAGLLAFCQIGIDSPPRMDEIGAYIACEDFVKKRLKAPSTADFGGYGNSKVSQGDNRFIVVSYVDAQNSFGAKLRNTWVCGVEADGSTWRLKNLDML